MGLFVCFFLLFLWKGSFKYFRFPRKFIGNIIVRNKCRYVWKFFLSFCRFQWTVLGNSELLMNVHSKRAFLPPFLVILKKSTKNCPTMSFCLYYTTRIAIPMVNWAFFKLYKMLTPLIKYTPMESFKRNIHTKNTLIYRQGKVFRQIRLLIWTWFIGQFVYPVGGI